MGSAFKPHQDNLKATCFRQMISQILIDVFGTYILFQDTHILILPGNLSGMH